MIESHYPTTEQLMGAQRTRRNLVFGGLILATAIIFGIIGALMHFTYTSGPIAWIVGVAAFLAVGLLYVIWHQPRVALYSLVLGAFLFEQNPGTLVPTMRVPFFWNISTAGQTYGAGNALGGLVFSFAEIIIVMGWLAWIVRAIAKREFRFERGAFFWSIMAYIGMVVFGYVHGRTTGGDSTMALYEVRAQFHFIAIYILTANLITKREHVYPLLWAAVIGAGVKGMMGSFNYFAMGGNVSEEGIMSHEDSLYFNVLFFILFLTIMSQSDRKLKIASWLLLPTTLLAALGNQRRSGIAAFIIAFIPLVPMLWVILEQRRPQVLRFAIVFFLLGSIYMPIAWNGQGAWALPARSIRSQSDPNGRDAASDYYRLAENGNLKFTRDLSPWYGFGYGKPFVELYQLATVSTDFLKFMPHNSVLWVWMRLGNIGFYLFLMMFATIIIKGCQMLKAVQNPLLQTIGALGVLVPLMVFTFGKYDLQLVSYRTMIMMGAFVGVLSILPKLDPNPKPAAETEDALKAPGEAAKRWRRRKAQAADAV